MSYEKQTWKEYNDELTEEQNIQVGAVVTAERMNHLETGLEEHDKNKSNPHQVTKEQIGLGNVSNVEQASKIDFNSHKNDKTNPHNVTKAQVGLSNVVNVEQASKAELTTHIASKTNPHSVTKSQVGLGNVDNFATATQAEAEAGLAKDKFMNPIGVKQHFDSRIATQVETESGVRNDVVITPKGLRAITTGDDPFIRKVDLLNLIDVSEWMPMSYNSTVKPFDDTVPKYRITTYPNGKKHLEFSGAFTGSTGSIISSSSQTLVTTLPVELRPTQVEIMPSQTSKFSVQGRVAVTTAGSFYIGQDSGSQVNGMYISGFGYWLN